MTARLDVLRDGWPLLVAGLRARNWLMTACLALALAWLMVRPPRPDEGEPGGYEKARGADRLWRRR